LVKRLLKGVAQGVAQGVAKEVVAWPRYGLLSNVCQTLLSYRLYQQLISGWARFTPYLLPIVVVTFFWGWRGSST